MKYIILLLILCSCTITQLEISEDILEIESKKSEEIRKDSAGLPVKYWMIRFDLLDF